jgi:hypothetical protein
MNAVYGHWQVSGYRVNYAISEPSLFGLQNDWPLSRRPCLLLHEGVEAGDESRWKMMLPTKCTKMVRMAIIKTRSLT